MTNSVPIAGVSRRANNKSPVKLVTNNSTRNATSMLSMVEFAGSRSAPPFQIKQADGADEQPDAAESAEDHRRAEIGIGRPPTEEVIVKRRDGGSGQVE